MKSKFLFRFFALSLILALALPHPAFALRAQAGLESRTASGLEQAFEAPHFSVSTVSAGAEEEEWRKQVGHYLDFFSKSARRLQQLTVGEWCWRFVSSESRRDYYQRVLDLRSRVIGFPLFSPEFLQLKQAVLYGNAPDVYRAIQRFSGELEDFLKGEESESLETGPDPEDPPHAEDLQIEKLRTLTRAREKLSPILDYALDSLPHTPEIRCLKAASAYACLTAYQEEMSELTFRFSTLVAGNFLPNVTLAQEILGADGPDLQGAAGEVSGALKQLRQSRRNSPWNSLANAAALQYLESSLNRALRVLSAGVEQAVAETPTRYGASSDIVQEVGFVLAGEAVALAPALALFAPKDFIAIVPMEEDAGWLIRTLTGDPEAQMVLGNRLIVLGVTQDSLDYNEKYSVAFEQAKQRLGRLDVREIKVLELDTLAQIEAILDSLGYRYPQDPGIQQSIRSLISAA